MNTHAMTQQRVPAPYYTQLLPQEGHGRWETVERKSQQCCISASQCVYLANTNEHKTSMEKKYNGKPLMECTKGHYF